MSSHAGTSEEELCTEERRSTPGGAVIAHATCRINRFADCTRQQDAGNCLDTNVRDCEWMPGVYGSTPTYPRYALCIPTVAPGLPFWDGTGQGICKEANNENTAAPKKTHIRTPSLLGMPTSRRLRTQTEHRRRAHTWRVL